VNIYEKIDAIFSGEAESRPEWANEILSELRDIKELLNNTKESKKSLALNSFIKEFRISMKANSKNTLLYAGKELGVNFKGLLYDKSNSRILPKDQAFEVYKYAHIHQENIKISA